MKTLKDIQPLGIEIIATSITDIKDGRKFCQAIVRAGVCMPILQEFNPNAKMLK
jgi:hypothetical protein